MSTNISVKIDVLKIDKARLFKGEKGTYLDATILMKDEPDQYGNIGMIIQNITKEEREAGQKGAILGNVKYIQKAVVPITTGQQAPELTDDLPF